MAFYQDTFAADAVNTSPPTGWGDVTSTANGTWSIQDLPPHYMRYSPIADVLAGIVWQTVGSNRVFNFFGKLKNNDAVTAGRISAGYSFENSGSTHMIRILMLSNGNMRLHVYRDSTLIVNDTLYGTGSFPIDSVLFVKMEYNGNSKTLHVKAWLDGSAEPAFIDKSASISTWATAQDLNTRALATPRPSTAFAAFYSAEVTSFQTVAITGTIPAQSTATGAASMQWSIDGSSAAQSDVTGLMGFLQLVEGTSAAQSGVTGAAQILRNMEAAADAQSTCQAELGLILPVSGEIGAASSVTGGILVSRLLSGQTDAVSFSIGTLNAIVARLEGTITAMSDAQLLSLQPLMVTVSGVSNVQGNLDRFEILRMNAQINFETHLIAQKPYWG